MTPRWAMNDYSARVASVYKLHGVSAVRFARNECADNGCPRLQIGLILEQSTKLVVHSLETLNNQAIVGQCRVPLAALPLQLRGTEASGVLAPVAIEDEEGAH